MLGYLGASFEGKCRYRIVEDKIQFIIPLVKIDMTQDMVTTRELHRRVKGLATNLDSKFKCIREKESTFHSRESIFCSCKTLIDLGSCEILGIILWNLLVLVIFLFRISWAFLIEVLKKTIERNLTNRVYSQLQH